MISLPTVRLEQHVHYYVYTQLNGGVTHIPATPSPVLVVFHSGATRLQGGNQRALLSSAFLAGPSLTPRQSFASPLTAFVSVLFRPGEVQRFFKIDVSELADTQVALTELIGAEADHLVDSVMRASGPDTMFDVVDHFLLGRARQTEMQSQRETPLRLPDCLVDVPLRSVAHTFGVSERQFQRRFAFHYGINFRDFRRLTQFGRALAVLLREPTSHGNLGHVAQQAGYFDHAHFDHTFQAFCGLSPSQLLRRMDEGDPAFWAFRFTARDMDRLFTTDKDVVSVQDAKKFGQYR